MEILIKAKSFLAIETNKKKIIVTSLLVGVISTIIINIVLSYQVATYVFNSQVIEIKTGIIDTNQNQNKQILGQVETMAINLSEHSNQIVAIKNKVSTIKSQMTEYSNHINSLYISINEIQEMLSSKKSDDEQISLAISNLYQTINSIETDMRNSLKIFKSNYKTDRQPQQIINKTSQPVMRKSGSELDGYKFIKVDKWNDENILILVRNRELVKLRVGHKLVGTTDDWKVKNINFEKNNATLSGENNEFVLKGGK